MKTAPEIAKTLKAHVSTVSPGQPFRLSDAHGVGDGVWQGDLGIEVIAATGVPADYVEVAHPKEVDRQLVPLDGSPGSHHRLAHLDGVRLFRPAEWGKNPADLRGPCVMFEQPNAIVHESGTAHPHGTVHIDAPMTIQCRYQRNLSEDMRAERARD